MQIIHGRTTVTDTNDNLIEGKEGITCGCGNPQFRMLTHIDGKDFYSYQYACICGNNVTVETKRDKEDVW